MSGAIDHNSGSAPGSVANSRANVGVLHPGAMGVSVAAALADGGHTVWWCEEGRSATTRGRAEAAGATGCTDLAGLARRCDSIISVCPPDQALAQAQSVAATNFVGCFVDANAISPESAQQVAELFGANYVDGGIIGPPATVAGTTRLYLSGADAPRVAELFAGSALEAIALAEGGMAASALKMCYAAWTKGSAALLLAVRALAEAGGVGAALEGEWQRSQPGLVRRAQGTAAGTAPKAWRFAGEMHEIADTFMAAGLPGGFHESAAELYAALAGFKDADSVSLEQVLGVLASSERNFAKMGG